jgi:hypothetical protein
MADKNYTDAFAYKPSSKRHQRAASAAPTLDNTSTRLFTSASRLPIQERRFDPPKSATSLAPREQPHPGDVQGLRERFESTRMVLSPSTLERPLRKTRSSVDQDESPVSATFFQESPHSPSLLSHFKHSMQLLGLSNVLKLYEAEPVDMNRTAVVPYDQATPAPRIAQLKKHARPPPPDANNLPESMSAFEYAMRPFISRDSHEKEPDVVPSPLFAKQDLVFSLSPTWRDSESAITSSFSIPISSDGSSSLGSNVKSPISEPRDPALLKKRSQFTSRIQLITLQTALVQCTMLQNTVQQMERKTWELKNTKDILWHYGKICKLAFIAIQLARELKDCGFQARCEYWAGRGYGGIRRYRTAQAHFREAIRLEESNTDDTDGAPRPKGLLPMEREDVHFLLECCRARLQDQEKRFEKIVEIATKESLRTRKPLRECVDETSMVSPPWMPDHDRTIELARRRFQHAKPPSKISELFVDREQGQALEAEVQMQWNMDKNDLNILTRKSLSKQEYEYIKHGARRRAMRHTKGTAANARPTPSQPDGLPKLPPGPANRVADPAEISPKLNPISPPANGILLGRRNVELETISTHSIQTQPHIGNAAHSSAITQESNIQVANAAGVRDVISTKTSPIRASSSSRKRIHSFESLNSRFTPEYETNVDAQSDFESEGSDSDESEDDEHTALPATTAQNDQRAQIESQRDKSRMKLAQLQSNDAPKGNPLRSGPTTPIRSRSRTSIKGGSKEIELQLRPRLNSYLSQSRSARSTCNSTMHSGSSPESPRSGIMI